MFGFFAVTVGSSQRYCNGKSVFFIFVAKTRWNQLYSIKNNILVCLPYNCVVASVIAPGKGFLPVCSDSPWLFT